MFYMFNLRDDELKSQSTKEPQIRTCLFNTDLKRPDFP